MEKKDFPMSQKLALLLGDMGITLLVYLFVTTVILARGSLITNFDLYQGMLPVQVILTGLLFNINGLYTIERKRFAEILLSVAVSMVQMLVLMMALTFFIREFALSRGVLLWCAGIDFVLLAAWRHLLWRYVRAHQEIHGVMLIGSEEECQHVYHRMKQQPQLAMELRSICTDLAGSDWKSAAEQVDVLIICPDIRLKDKAKLVHYCNLHEKQALLIPNAYEVFCSGMTLDKIDDVPVFRPQHLLLTLEQRSLKRILDIVVALTGFLLALPLMILTAIAIKMFDPGPVFYSQERSGRYEKPFKVYKFRTMRVDAEKLSGPMLAQENDPRITRLGAFLRAVRLDELPQIWNVLVGDMSIVGPRPERPFFVEKFKEEIPEYVYRMNVKPGITGLAQVYGKYNTTAYDKLIYDLVYIQNAGLRTDLTIILQTVCVLFQKSATEGVHDVRSKESLKEFDIQKNIYGDF